MSSVTTRVSSIKKTNAEKQIVYGEVYAPGQLDTYGEMMLAEDIELLAHRFMELEDLKGTIDTMHDNKATGCYPVESFIARKGDLDYTEGAWVLGVKITDSAIWEKIKRGELNGFSFEALVLKVAVVAEVEYDPESIGMTEEQDGHRHLFYARLNADGVVVRGQTSTEVGHSHKILRATATEEAAGHAHRYFV